MSLCCHTHTHPNHHPHTPTHPAARTYLDQLRAAAGDGDGDDDDGAGLLGGGGGAVGDEELAERLRLDALEVGVG